MSQTKTTVTAVTKEKTKLLEKLSMLWTVVSVLFSAGFTVFGLFSKWGKSTYWYVMFAVLAAYFVIFILFIILSARRDKKKFEFPLSQPPQNSADSENEKAGLSNGAESEIQTQAADAQRAGLTGFSKFPKKRKKKTRKRIKALKSGLAILKGISNILYIVMTITIMAGAASMNDAHSVFSWIVISVALLLAVLWLSFKITLLVIKTVLPRLVRKNTYAVYNVINGKVQESERLNRIIKKFSDKHRKEQ